MAVGNSVRSLLMDAIANDYEDLDTIRIDVNRWASDEAIEITDEAIGVGLKDLVRLGLAGAYRCGPDRHLERVFSADQVDVSECFFLLTPEGQLALERDS
jgi:hypothetical protein